MFRITITLIFSLISTTSFANCARILNTGLGDWAPYQYLTNNTPQGMDVELLTYISKEMKCEFKFNQMPWKRVLASVKEGKLDFAMAASITQEREQYAYFTHPYRQEIMSLYITAQNAEDFNIDVIEDLVHSNFTLGIERGFFYGDETRLVLEHPSYKQNIQPVGRVDENIKKAKAGRIDGFIGDPITIQFYFRNNNIPSTLVKKDIVVNSNNVHLMLSKRSLSVSDLEMFNKNLEIITASEGYKKILSRYLGK